MLLRDGFAPLKLIAARLACEGVEPGSLDGAGAFFTGLLSKACGKAFASLCTSELFINESACSGVVVDWRLGDLTDGSGQSKTSSRGSLPELTFMR